jgi:succinate-semialdehyde dehydrogenase/glutarate-semialdehyde dehydrogenase
MEFKTINPYNGQLIETFQSLSQEELKEKLDLGHNAFQQWRKTSFAERSRLMNKVADILERKTEQYAQTISQEMGKPIKEARAEVKKCAWVCRYYAQNAEDFLKDEIIETEASKSFVRHDPQGIIFAIMPWNFPFWQVFRFAAPTLMAGNAAVLKHAANVFGSAAHIEDIFREAGFPDHVFQNLIIHHDKAEFVIRHPAVRAVTLTGSERAGSAVASQAGKYIKRSLLELGGSNAFIVLEDADMEQAIQTGVNARMMNTGQSCIAAKRFILVGEAYERFVPGFIAAIKQLKSGDPLHEDTQIGTLAREDLAVELQRQVQESMAAGAVLACGGKQSGAYHEPTVLLQVKPGMPAFDEETFGPLAALIHAKDEEEAFELAARSDFGLGLTVMTQDIEKALQYADRVEDGAYFINELVKSDPRLPFGGTKISGYGRELSRDGILEFVNRKTVFVK